MAQAMPREQHIVQYGPYGRETKPTFNFILEKTDRIKTVTVGTGSIVDVIGFEIVDQSGNSKTLSYGGHGHETLQIHMTNAEYITKISGLQGEYQFDNYGRNVAQIKIHTNLAPNGYGPYGRALNCRDLKPFDTPAGSVVGFLGASGTFLQSIGVSAKKE
ncbi:hypothetical protein vseg_010959 [Gypsophila vaccaria]